MNKIINFVIKVGKKLSLFDKFSERHSFILGGFSGSIYNQDYPKRLKHTFPDNNHWKEKIEFNGNKVKRWKKHLFERYIEV